MRDRPQNLVRIPVIPRDTSVILFNRAWYLDRTRLLVWGVVFLVLAGALLAWLRKAGL